MAQDLTRPDPAPVMELLEAFRRSKTMFAAVSLGVFDALSAGPQPLDALAQKLKANADGLERLLDACVGLGLLQKSGDRYDNTSTAAAYLTSQASRLWFFGDDWDFLLQRSLTGLRDGYTYYTRTGGSIPAGSVELALTPTGGSSSRRGRGAAAPRCRR